jgi:aminomethyltransferase
VRTTTLFDQHTALGASFTDFGGWNMPIRYGNELAEHAAVRQAAGLFDISHMGEIWVRGEGAAAALDYALSAWISKLAVGRAKYSLICNEQGGIIDDLIVYRVADNEFLVVSNASNYPRVAAELESRAAGFEATVADESEHWSLLALQGPAAAKLLQSLTDTDLSSLRYYSIADGQVGGNLVMFARTGYTGEDGFELLVSNDAVAQLWRLLLNLDGVVPCGLAARDTLRLEAGMPLYGNELGLETMPAEVGLARAAAADKPDGFVGAKALEGATQRRRLIGLRGDGRRAARHGYPVLSGGRVVGEVTSGALSPTLGYPIAMALVEVASSGPYLVDIRGTEQEFAETDLPFYKRA